MPFEKGHKKVGGRQKGSISKDRQMVIDKCAELGVDPFTILALIAMGDWKALGYDSPGAIKRDKHCEWLELTISVDAREKAAANLARHIVPQLKSVDVSLDKDHGPIAVTISLAEPNGSQHQPKRPDESST